MLAKFNELVKSPKTLFSVIPVKTGIQENQDVLDSRLRGSDDQGDFLRGRQVLWNRKNFIFSQSRQKRQGKTI